jgi:MFS family permease
VTHGRHERPWLVLGAVAFANLVVAATHFGLAAAAPIVRDDLGLTTAQLGLLLAAPPIGLMLGTFGWGVLADRTSERRVLVGAFVAFAVATYGAAHAYERVDVAATMLALLLAGAFGSAAHSAGGRAISAAFPPGRHGLVLSIRHTAIPVGAAIGGVALPMLAPRIGIDGVLRIGAACGLVAAVILAWWIPSSRGAVARAARALDVPGISPLRLRPMWLLAGGAGSLAFVQLGIGSYLTVQLVDEAGMRVAVAAGVFTVAQLLGAGGRILLGVWSDRSGERVRVLVAVAAGAAVLVLASLIAGDPLVSGMLQAAALVVVTSCNGVVVAVAASLAPAGRTGATLGMQTTVNAFACSIAPILLGIVASRSGWTAFAWVLVAVLAMSLASLLRLRRHVAAAQDPVVAPDVS